MKKKSLVVGVFLIISLLLANISLAAVGSWKTYESDNFVVFYPLGYEYQAQETLYYLEKHRPQIIELTGNEMSGSKIHVTIEDIGLYTNGYANPINNKIGIFTNQPESYSGLLGYQNWYRLVNIHELTHIAQLNNTSGLSSVSTSVFGNLFSPNLHTPLWLIEGIAVYNESQTSPYEGRLNGTYYDAVLSGRAKEGELPSLAEINYTHDHFPRGQQYLYGAYFFQYLAEQYGEEKFAELFNTYGSYFWAPFIGNLYPVVGLDRAANKVYGKDFSSLYDEWQEYEREQNRDWELEGDKIIATQHGYISDLTATEDKLYYFKSHSLNSYPFDHGRINKLIEYNPKTEQSKVLKATRGRNFATMQIKDNVLYYVLAESKAGYANVDSSARGLVGNLYSYNLKTGEENLIFSDEIKDFIVLEDQKIIYTKSNKKEHGSEILSYHKGNKESLWVVAELISEMELYQDEIIIVSKSNLSTWGISKLDPFELRVEPLIVSAWREKNINVVEDKLYFTANYEGYEAIYSYGLKDQTGAKLTEGGYANTGTLLAGEIYYLTYDLSGMAIYKTEANGENYSLPEMELDRMRSEIDFSQLKIEVEASDGFGKNLSYLLRPNMRFFPSLVAGEDALGLNSYQVNYSPYGGLDFHATTRMLNPVTVSVSNIKEGEERRTDLNLFYPVYQSNLDGLSAIRLDLTTDFEQIIPGVAFNFNYPYHDLSLYLQGDIRDYDYKTELDYKYLLNRGSLSFSGTVFSGFEDSRDIREFDLKSDQFNGYKTSLDYTHKLAELRKGSWNPNFFVGDLYGNAFVDYSNFETDELLSGGYEIMLEYGVANRLYFVPRLGFKVSKYESDVYVGFQTQF